MRRTCSIATTFSLILCVFGCAGDRVLAGDDDHNEWVKLGEMKADRERDRDDIMVSEGPTYSKIRFRVHGPAVRFDRAKVFYGNGDTQDIQIDKTVENDESTGSLDVQGKERHIKRVTVWYKTVGERRPGDATVSLWALR